MTSYFETRPRLLAVLELNLSQRSVRSCHVAYKQLVDLRLLGYVEFEDTEAKCFEAQYTESLVTLLDDLSNA